MSGLSFIPLGVGDAFSALYYPASLAVESDGHWLLVDCPHPIRKILREASTEGGEYLDVDLFEAVVLTHLHADHCSGLEAMASAIRFALGRKARLIAHPEVLEPLWPKHLEVGLSRMLGADGEWTTHTLADYFDTTALSEERAVKIGPFSVECKKTVHHVPTTALRIRAGERCLAYSADTRFDPSVIDWLAEAHLVVHETNYGAGHTAFEKLRTLPQARRRKMRLISFPDDLEIPADTIEPLRQGVRYTV